MKVWEIVKRVCNLPAVEIEGLSLRLRIGDSYLGTVTWEERPALDTKPFS